MTERAKILLVDDRPENLLALEAILGSLDVDLIRAGSGEEALRALLRAEFALILLDAQMPGMDGYETATRIKCRTRTRDVPIIFLTAVDKDLNSSYRGYVAGGADYISKPFDPWILRAKVQVFVSLWESGRLQAGQAALRREPDGADLGQLRELRDRFDGLDDAIGRLAAELAEGPEPAPAALEEVQQRLEGLRAAIAPTHAPG